MGAAAGRATLALGLVKAILAMPAFPGALT